MAFRRRTKSHPLFSQEFLIHNHADIGFCLVLSVLIALMFEVRTPPPAPFPLLRPFPLSPLSHPHACPTRSCPAPLAPPTEGSPATTATPRPSHPDVLPSVWVPSVHPSVDGASRWPPSR